MIKLLKFRYAATVRVQKHRLEIIEDLSAMVKEHLVMFYKSTGSSLFDHMVMVMVSGSWSWWDSNLLHVNEASNKAENFLNNAF